MPELSWSSSFLQGLGNTRPERPNFMNHRAAGASGSEKTKSRRLNSAPHRDHPDSYPQTLYVARGTLAAPSGVEGQPKRRQRLLTGVRHVWPPATSTGAYHLSFSAKDLKTPVRNVRELERHILRRLTPLGRECRALSGGLQPKALSPYSPPCYFTFLRSTKYNTAPTIEMGTPATLYGWMAIISPPNQRAKPTTTQIAPDFLI